MHIMYFNLGNILGTNITSSLALRLIGMSMLIILNIRLQNSQFNLLLLPITLFWVFFLLNLNLFWLWNRGWNIFEVFKQVVLISLGLFSVFAASQRSTLKNSHSFLNIYFCFLRLNILFILLQLILNHFFKINLIFPWQGTPLLAGSFRPCGLLGEPAHAGIFFMGILFLRSQQIRERRSLLIWSILALFFTFSLISIIVASALTVKIYFSLDMASRKYPLLICIAVLSIFIIYRDHPRIIRIQGSLSFSGGSAYPRVIQGLEIYGGLDLKEKFFGISPGNDLVKSEKLARQTRNRPYFDDFISGMMGELISYGLIPSIMVNLLILQCLYFNRHPEWIMLFVILMRFGTQLGIDNPFLPFILMLSLFSSSGPDISSVGTTVSGKDVVN